MLLDAIRSNLEALSKSEKKVALTILANPQMALSENLTALAKNARVSEPTVIRFCRAVGYEGWHDFKLKLAQGLALALPGANAGSFEVAAGVQVPALAMYLAARVRMSLSFSRRSRSSSSP